MKLRILIAGMCLLGLPAVSEAQTKAKTTTKTKTATQVKDKKTVKTAEKETGTSLTMESVEVHEAKSPIPTPKWALSQGYMNDRPVYFPDYYLFYTPERGYIYWGNSGWETSPDVPEPFKAADLRKARAQIMADDEVSDHPEKEFRKYKSAYPAEPVSIAVPVPAVR